MKKRNSVAILAFLAAMLFVFAACGKGDKDKKDENETNATTAGVAYEEVTVVQTDASGEAVTDAEGNTSVITVTRPVTTKPSSNSSSAETTPDGEKVDVDVDASGVPVDSKLKKLVNSITSKNAIFVDGSMPMEGQSVAVKVYIKGDNFATEMKMGATNVRVIYTKDSVKMIFPSLKYYITMPPESVGPMDTQKMMSMVEKMASDELKYVETTNVQLDGKSYICETYQDGVNTNKYYFDSNDNLKRIDIVDSNGTSEVTNFNEFSANVPDGVFSIPSGYKEITEDNIGALAGLMGSF
ncbi:MAG: hypothetical protein IKK37_08165 [Clostridia bacterium]|nr:hypothetical protein [Clostridia bacterium]